MARHRDVWQDVETFFDRAGAMVIDSGQTEGPEASFIEQLTRRAPVSKSFHRWLQTLKHEGWLSFSKDDGLIRVDVREGRLRIHPKGFGFVVSENHPGADAFVPERHLGGARHDDVVKIWTRPNGNGPGPEGIVLRIVRRSTDQVIGRLERRHQRWQVIAEDRRLPNVRVPVPDDAQPGDLVVASIERWPDDSGEPVEGKVVRRIGHPSEPGVDISALMASRRLPFEFPEAVLAEAERLESSVRPEDLPGRVDLRDQHIVTIDGSDAKDLDDAISVEKVSSGYRVGVHIADVSYYVREGSPLDQEARERGTSVYLVDRVIPMLPVRLSNGIASLNPHVARLTLSAWIELDAKGQVIKTDFGRSVIATRHRLTYEGVNRVLAGEAEADDPLRTLLTAAREVRDLRYHLRTKRGAVDFDLPEPRVVLDDEGRATDIEVRSHGLAESIIEEFMLLANEAVAEKLRQAKLPGMFRVHEAPLEEKIEQFREMIGVLGYRLPKTVSAKSLQTVLQKAKGTPEERVISSALLRSMRQARYGEQNLGHFGLASTEYTHFTSPIRRYPDLFVHRVLTEHLAGTLDEARLASLRSQVGVVADLASRREREAMEAERESVLIKEVEYMADKVGEPYLGVVSGVTGFGVFVELPNLIEGLIRVEDLPHDSWSFDRVHYRLSGLRSGQSYRIGDTVSVVVARVDIALRRIDLVLKESLGRVHPKSVREPRVKRHRVASAPMGASASKRRRSGSGKRRRRRAGTRQHQP